MPRARLRGLPDDGEELARLGLAHQDAALMPMSELLTRLFEWAGKPVEFNALVAVVAELRGVKDQPDVHIEDSREAMTRQSAEQNAAEEYERRDLLRRAWAEIRQLTPRQRAAYLLNFQESQGHADITTFLYTRTATIEEIAEALEMSIEELSELWGSLPLRDKEIARRLNATEQQVASLRKCARARLKRRLSRVMKMVACAAGWLYPVGLHIFSK